MFQLVFTLLKRGVGVGGEQRHTARDLRDDGAEPGVAVFVLAPELVRGEVYLGEQALEVALEGFLFNILETLLQGIEEGAVLGLGKEDDVFPEIVGLDDIVVVELELEGLEPDAECHAVGDLLELISV